MQDVIIIDLNESQIKVLTNVDFYMQLFTNILNSTNSFKSLYNRHLET